MPGPQIVVEMDANEAKLWSAYQRIIQGETQMEAGMKKVSRATNEAAKEQRDLERSAKRVLDSIATPQEKFNQKLQELGRLFTASKLTAEQFRAAVTKVRTEYDALNRVVDTQSQTLEKAAQAGTRAFGPQMLASVRGLLGALGIGTGLAGALQLVNNEYDALKERQALAARESMSVADAQIKALRNLSPKSAAERDEFIANIQALAMETGVPTKDLYLRAGSAMSARGALSKEAALAAVGASARLVPEDMGEGEIVAGAALDLMKVTGATNAEAAIGFLMETVERSRITKTGQVAKNVVQPMIASMIRGDQASEAAALFAAITTGSGDVKGEMSGTAMATLAQQLAETFPELGSTRARIEAIQRSPQMQKRIIPELKGESKTRGVMEQLLRGEGGVSAAYSQYLETMPDIEGSEETFRRLAGMVAGTELQKTARFARQIQATTEGLAVADQTGARIGAIREQFVPLLKQTGMGDLATKLEGLGVRASGDELSGFMASLAEQEGRLRMRGGGAWRRSERERIGEEAFAARERTREAQAEVLSALRDVYERLAAPDPQMDQQTALLSKIADNTARAAGDRRPQVPVASSSANSVNRE